MYRYWLANFTKLSTRRMKPLLDYFSSAQNVYYASKGELMAAGLPEKAADGLLASKWGYDLEGEWCQFTKLGLGFLTLEDKQYPDKLRTIADPPYALFYKGRLPDPKQKSVAIVGARLRSAYGESIAKDLSLALAEQQISVFSGLAMGIDADAHKGAIEGGGYTCGILGCGIDVVYPKCNGFLYQSILAHDGGIISEFPLHTQAAQINFPRRNRIISALSDYVVVIEAKEKSGSLITAEYALEQGKEVYAVPGRICDSLSRGCNRILQDGGGVFLSVEDFLNEIQMTDDMQKNTKKCKKNTLEKEERLLYSLIDFNPIGIGSLMQGSALSFSSILKGIASLQDKGLIKEEPSNFFVRCNI